MMNLLLVAAATLALLLLLLLLLGLILMAEMRIIKWVFIKFPAWASGGGDGLYRINGFISASFWATSSRTGPHHHLLHMFFFFCKCYVLAFLFFCV